MAADHPDRVDALALSGPTLIDTALRAKLPEVAATPPIDEDGGHLVRRWRRIRQMDRDVPLDIAQRETLNAIALEDRYLAAYEAVMAHDAERALAALTCPVLVFAGTRDVLHPQLDAAHTLLANGTKREIADAGTLVCETHCRESPHCCANFSRRQPHEPPARHSRGRETAGIHPGPRPFSIDPRLNPPRRPVA